MQFLRILSESRILVFVERFFHSSRRAWGESAVRYHAIGSLAELEPWQRLRLIGWVVVVSAVVRMLFRSGASSPSSLQLVGRLAVFALGAVLAWWPRPIAKAWAAVRARQTDKKADPSS